MRLYSVLMKMKSRLVSKSTVYIYIPESDISFWGGVYKCICNIKESPKELRYKALGWLIEHGMSPIIK